MVGKVEQILTSEDAGSALTSQPSASLVKGLGIEGDRYYYKKGTFSELLLKNGDFEVTLIEQEKIEAFNKATQLNYSALNFRRNILTSGIELNALVGKDFKIGSVVLTCVRLCEPCAHLAGLIGQSIMEHMVHKAGIRAVIKQSGEIAVGDAVEPIK